jgi:phospho-N-acetylmuramoyl-pentapeptide-transferase
MLIWLADRIAAFLPSSNWAAALGGFSKITFRTTLAALASFVLSVILGPRLIHWLRSRFREPLSNRSPQLDEINKHKAWTPTMGGLFLVAGVLAAAVLLCRWQNHYLPVLLVTLLGFGAIGAIDDLRKLNGYGGLRARTKLLAQLSVASVAAVWLYRIQCDTAGGLDLQIPLVGDVIPLGPWFILLAILVIVGTSNAVNLADGLDGLAGGCLISTTGAVAVMAYVAGHVELASYLGVTHLPEAGEAVVVAGAMIGGTLGFLWFNCQPAQVFMGDTGALALGAMLGMLSLIARQELLLLVAGGVFVAEVASVMLQIASTRWWGRRVFRCAPLHHHFQFLGWAENTIVTRFWIVSMLCALVSLGAMKMNRVDESLGSHRPEYPALQIPIREDQKEANKSPDPANNDRPASANLPQTRYVCTAL